MILSAYRITQKQFASTIWSGTGARDFGGRWNSKGVAVVYAADSRSLAAIEQLVHLIKPRVLTGYVVASIAFDVSRSLRVDPRTLPMGWDNPIAPSSLKKYGDDWLIDGKFPVLAVPSAVIAGEWNYLFNPSHAEFATMKKTAPVQFVYDSRLA